MNHERFGWREDEGSNSGRDNGEHDRYPRRSGADRGERYEQGMGYRGEQDRDEMGRFRSNSQYVGSSYGRGGYSSYDDDYGRRGRGRGGMERGYGSGGWERDRDSHGRFVSDRVCRGRLNRRYMGKAWRRN